jgi:hypothetical protein
MAISTFVRDVARGVLTLTHSGLAMLGLVLVLVLGGAVFRPDLLSEAETSVYAFLRERQLSLWWEPQNTADRATATDLKDIPSRQAAVAAWLAKKYKVAPEPIAALVSEAYALSETSRLKPHLILAVMAIESSFHPYVQSQAGAQGLMQVMTEIHAQKYQKYIRLKGGSVEQGLLFYLGGDSIQGETDYVAKVLAEQARLDQVAAGIKVSTQP